MLGDAPTDLPQRIGFVLVPSFSLFAMSGAMAALRHANRLSGRRLYRWVTLTTHGDPVMSSDGIKMTPDGALDAANGLETIFVCGGSEAHHYRDPDLTKWLRTKASAGADIGAIGDGAFLLAQIGLLDGHQATVHWEDLPAFVEAFPDIDATDELFEIDRSRFTCAGGTAAVDMMVNIIAAQHGNQLAGRVADEFILDRIRDRHDHQQVSITRRLGVRHPNLTTVTDLMEANVEEPLSRKELAYYAGMSTRQVERLFRKYLGRSPARYYLELRLDRARRLLSRTNMSVLEVATACGFVSASHFSKCFRDYFGHKPNEERNPATAKLSEASTRGTHPTRTGGNGSAPATTKPGSKVPQTA